jgi:hypothetical protein
VNFDVVCVDLADVRAKGAVTPLTFRICRKIIFPITENWRGKPLVSRAVLINPIGSTKTRAGLTIKAERDENTYPIRIKASDEELAAVRIKKR